MLNQKLQQTLQQKLSPQQILLMKLLQIPAVALEQRIKQEIEENPALEIINEYDEDAEYSENNDEDSRIDSETKETDNSDDEFDFSDYLDEDDVPAYKLSISNTSPDDDRREIPFASSVSSQEFLISQLGMRNLTEKQNKIALNIIGNIDEAGYLSRDPASMVDDLAFSQNISATKEEILEVLAVIQEFEPVGIGARSLQECLLIQLRKLEPAGDDVKHAITIIDRYFNEFAKKHYDKIIKRYKITEDELKDAISIILKLNPKPGNSLSETSRTNYYIQPDFNIINNGGILELSLNSRNTPELKLNRTYIDMLESYSEAKNKSKFRDTLMFVKQKIDSAKWFIDAIKQRQNTLLLTMNAIMEFQHDYFVTGDETRLKPMILKDIAERINLDISTVSRVANSKYVETPFGTFLLKSFFSESMQMDDGQEVSTREIKKILSDCIQEEKKDRPLTDEELTKLLRKKGYNIARRTVAKYREQLGIAVARLRKEL